MCWRDIKVNESAKLRFLVLFTLVKACMRSHSCYFVPGLFTAFVVSSPRALEVDGGSLFPWVCDKAELHECYIQGIMLIRIYFFV